MSSPIEMQWELLQAIPHYPRKATSRSLTEKLRIAGHDIDKRSVERHLRNLLNVFPLVVDDSERPYGWSWARDAATMSIPGMALQTALAFVAAESFLRPLLPQSTFAHLAAHFDEARKRLAREPTTFGSWKNKVRSLPRGFRLQAPHVDADIESTVYEALLTNSVLDITYQSRNDEMTRQFDEVHPLALVFRDPVIYLVCTMWGYDEPRQLLLHRMKSAAPTGARSRRLAGFTIDDYIASGEFGFRVGPEIRLDAVFDAAAAAHLYETPVSSDQVLTVQRDGRVRVRATVQHTEELVWWLRGFGDLVEVRTPQMA
ncbi:MAG: helix-turn-helix transcriptional regulator [Gammaproteobacteria bacterium]